VNVKAVAEVLRMLADAVEAPGETSPAPTVEAPACAWVPILKCGLPTRTARRLVRERAITASRVGRDVYVKREDVNAWIESQRIDRPGDGEADEVDRALRAKRLRLVGRGR
jgi:excisionase family DNA binding protein